MDDDIASELHGLIVELMERVEKLEHHYHTGIRYAGPSYQEES